MPVLVKKLGVMFGIVMVVGSGSIEFMFEMSVVMELRNLCF